MASFHTIICQRGCTLKHNDLVLALQEPIGPNAEGKWKSVGKNEEVFRRCVDRLLENNWKKNSDLPEALDRLRYPLVHVCCLLGKPDALDFLINSRNFDPAVQCSRTGETAIHATLRYYYDIFFNHPRSQLESLSYSELREGNNECIAIFEKLLKILTAKTDRILHVKDSISRVTVFHLAAVKRAEASKELQVYRVSNKVLKVEQRDSTRESILMYEISFYDQCLRLLASKLDENAGLEVLRFDTNRRGQTVVDILAADPCGSARETLQFFADRFPALNAVLQKKSFRIQHEPAEATAVESPTTGTSRETCDDQETQVIPHQHSEPHASSSPELACPSEATGQDSQLEGTQRIDLHDTVIVKIERDQEEPNVRLIHQSSSPCTHQSATQSSLRDLLIQRGGSSSCMAMVTPNTTKNVSQGSFCAAAANSATPGPSGGAKNAQTKCSAAVLSPFLELLIKEGIELDETTHNNIMSAIEERCSQKLSEIDSKLSCLNEQSFVNEKEINERFFMVQKKKAQMDKVRSEIISMNRQIVSLKNEVERKVEMGKMIQLEVHQLEQDLNKTKEFGGALELKRKQLSEEQQQVEEKLSLCEGRKQNAVNGHLHKKQKR